MPPRRRGPVGRPNCPSAKRPYPPGMHGRGRKRISEYQVRLLEKQKLRHIYGVGERQMRAYYEKASRKTAVTGEEMIRQLETRLDAVFLRLGFALTQRQARQLVSHGHVKLNGRRMDVPSAQVKPEDTIELSDKAKNFVYVNEAIQLTPDPPPYLYRNKDVPGHDVPLPRAQRDPAPGPHRGAADHRVLLVDPAYYPCSGLEYAHQVGIEWAGERVDRTPFWEVAGSLAGAWRAEALEGVPHEGGGSSPQGGGGGPGQQKGPMSLSRLGPNLGDYVVEILESEPLEASTRYQHTKAFERWIKPGLGSYPIGDINSTSLRQFFAWMRREGASDSTVGRVRAVMTKFFRRAHQEGILPRNPLASVPAPSTTRREIRIVSRQGGPGHR